jgi:hypothetical protein
MKNGVFWDVTPCGSCKRDVSEELSASFIRVTIIGELATDARCEEITSEGGAKFLRNVGSCKSHTA